MTRFKDRIDAGIKLAKLLVGYRKQPNTVVLGLARGGVVVAYEIARALDLPFNVLIPRKISAPDNPELAIGAMSEEGDVWLNQSLIQELKISPVAVAHARAKAKAEIDRRVKLYRNIKPVSQLSGKITIVVDDGVATGATLFAEIIALRKQQAAAIIVASPVASTHCWSDLEKAVDRTFCLQCREDFSGISEFYQDFSQVEDEMVLSLLARSTKAI